MMNKLPFLKGAKWPRTAKPTETSEYGFSDDDRLKEDAVNELLAAIAAGDHIGLIESLKALIHLIHSKEASHDAQTSPA